jgi:RNA polymerase sigma-70 factor (ECF subfamily)
MVRGLGAADRGEKPTVSPKSRDDARLLERIGDGDLRAFEELYRLYHPRLARFLGRMVRRPQVVEELVNDTLLAVWRRPETFNAQSKVSTWIFAIAYRKALKASRRFDEPIEDPDADRRMSFDDGPEQHLGRRQVREALIEAMQQLSADHRTVVDLTYFHDFGYREIAEIMDCPVDTVKTRMFHARRCLKGVLAGGLSDWV